MTSVLGRSRHQATDTGKAVKYTPCSNRGDQTDEEELEEIAVVESNNHCTTNGGGGSGNEAATPDSQAGEGDTATANGPRVLSGCGDRTKLIGERLAGGTSSGRNSVSSPVYAGARMADPPRHYRSTSRASLFEVVSNKIDLVKGSKKIRDYSHASQINKAYNPEPMTPKEIRKHRRKEINERFGKKNESINNMDMLTDISEKEGCRWTFVFDPSGRLAYWWSFVVSIAFIYNFWVIIYRFAFEEINWDNMAVWFTCDYLADLLYVLDIAFHFRTGYLEDGVLQTDSIRLRIHYMNSTMFYIDCLCLLPLDFLYLSIGFKSMLRCFRLIKIYRFWAFLDRTERHTNFPNVVRTITLLHYLFCIYHWNACIMYIVSRHFDNDPWLFPAEDIDTFSKYLHALHWSTLTLTTIGELPEPRSKGEYMFVIVEFVLALLLFSSVLGHVANIVTSISNARKEFQAKLDSVKTYMSLRRVPLRLQDRVIKWFDYLWLSKKSSDEDKTLNLLPDKLKAEIALHVHLDTLKRVEIFQNTEAGFLCELVLKLRPVLFSPRDYICRKGEIGKEMYIVNRGRLQVVADNGKTILATLRPGSYFGEISILNMGNAGNRRTASVRSVGYSDLFVLSKKDLWDVLLDYPTARVRLEAIAVKRLQKYKKPSLTPDDEDMKKAAIPRSKSTPGLVESQGQQDLETMLINQHNTLPAGLGSRQTSVEGGRSSTAASSSQRADSSSRGGSRGGSQHSSHMGRSSAAGDKGERGGGDLQRAADLTNSMTVSSLTSYVTESSAPLMQDVSKLSSQPSSPYHHPHHPPHHHQSPQSLSQLPPPPPQAQTGSLAMPPAIVAPSAFRPIEAFPRPDSGPGTFAPDINVTMVQAAGGSGGAEGITTGHRPSQLISPSVSPIMSGYQTHPPPAHITRVGSSGGPGMLSTGGGGSQHPPTGSQSMFQVGAVSPHHISASASSLSRDPSHDLLLQEITRLRNRLQSLESENASMSYKLNQQQWEVEHRLSEIEMHICGSDSVDSEEKSSLQGNKESII